MIAANLDWHLLMPALAAGILVLATHVPLGQEVLKRGIIFIDLAIAQMAALGHGGDHTGWRRSRTLAAIDCRRQCAQWSRTGVVA